MTKILAFALALACCLPCHAAPKKKKKAVSRDKVYQLVKAGDGDGLKAYLKPFFDEGKGASRADLENNSGGFRTLVKPEEKAGVMATVIAAKRLSGSMYFIEVFAPASLGEPWFKNHMNYSPDPEQVQRAKVTSSRRELKLEVRLNSGNYAYEIYARKSGKYLITRQVSRENGRGPTEDYGFYDRSYRPPLPRLNIAR